ncbi:MAG: DUF1822 family protein [Cyanothece sp. SIO2G6]|nr:DUF1822 family protein [Cyanothece sp. SIO2G6]
MNDLSDMASPQSLQADVELLTAQTVTLLPDSLDRAQLACQTVRSAEQWQAYQNAIALFGLQQWLAERGIDIADGVETCSVYDQAIAGLLSGVCQLQIGQFKVCLIPLGSLTDDHIAVPRATLELADYVPHLFIGVEVQAELNRVTFWGSLRLDTLRDRLQEHPDLETDDNWVYRIPQQWFHPDPNAALLYLRCLDATAIARIPLMPAVQANPTPLQANLPILRSRLQTSQRPLWKLLPWSQAIALYQQPALALDLLQPEIPAAPSTQTNPGINVGQWLQGQLDNVAQTLNWTLLPSVAPAFRSAAAFRQLHPSLAQFEAVLHSLSIQGIDIPPHARGGYANIPINPQQQARLYVVIWDSSTTHEPAEWTLLVAVGALPDQPLPPAITLQIADQEQVLDRQAFERNATNTHLYSAVSGAWDERFWVTLGIDGDRSIALPPFVFNPTDFTHSF